MSDADVRSLAHAAGLQLEWTDETGQPREVSVGVLSAVLEALDLPAGTEAERRASTAELQLRKAVEAGPLISAEAGQPIALPGRPGSWQLTLEGGDRLEGAAGSAPDWQRVPAGYHELEVPGWSGTLAVAPARGWTLEEAGSGGRLAGLAAQTYSLWRHGHSGNGDFAALGELARRAAPHGIDAIAISPVHALFTADPGRAAPYAPSSRIALNPAYAPCEKMPAGCAAEELIDWPTAVPRRLAALRDEFSRETESQGFATFRKRADSAIYLHALFEAIAAAEVAKGGAADWRRWPPSLSSPANAEAKRFAEQAAIEVAFHLYLQYRAETGLAAAGRVARQCGMRIGLIADLAVGADPGGSDAWIRQAEMLRGLSIGAPPDSFNRAGQSWGLTTFSPFGLRRSGFSGWIRMLRAAFAHSGGVRIDHAMGLTRLWVIPDGATPGDGVYLSYPSQDLMRLVALESLRHRAVVLAEDLGTVPPGFPERLVASGMAGLRVLWFEREAGGFRPPQSWTPMATAMTSTHDLPTVAGWWKERDIEWRERLGLRHDSRAARGRDRRLLWQAFCAAGAAEGEEPGAEAGGTVASAATRFIARTASRLALLPLEDALALSEQPNLPGTTEGHPNWCRRLPLPVESLFESPDVALRLTALRARRGEA